MPPQIALSSINVLKNLQRRARELTLSQRPFCLTPKADKAVEPQRADGPGR